MLASLLPDDSDEELLPGNSGRSVLRCNELPGGVPPDSSDRNFRLSSGQLMQDVIPKTPAKAVATVMITLRTTPHTDFDFVLMLFGFNVKNK